MVSTHERTMGMILACLEEAGELYVLLRLMVRVGEVTPRVGRWKDGGAAVIARPSLLEQCVAWYWHVDGGVAILEK